MDAPPLRLETVTGGPAALRPLLPTLARLRIAVFREWPYLYDGDAAYEERHLAVYAESPGAAMVLALAGDEPVGVATCQPLAEAAEEVRGAFARRGIDPARVCYFGAARASASSRRGRRTRAPSASPPPPSARCCATRTTRAGRRTTCRSTASGAGAATRPALTSPAPWLGRSSAGTGRRRTASTPG